MIDETTTQTDEMACQELVELVTEYLEGTMPASDRKRFEAHLKACPYCRTYVAQMRTVTATLGRIDAESLSPQAQFELLEAFRDWRSARG